MVTGSVAGTVSSVLYNGSATVPTAAGTYAVTANFAPTDSTDYSSLTAASAGNFVISNDTTPPTVSLTAPTASSTVSGSSVTLTAIASDNVAVANVQFEVDGTHVGSAVTTSPYAVTWNSTGVADGLHTLSAVAEDTSSNYATSSESITVDNPPIISLISSGSPTTTTATITWTTNEPANSEVVYGATTSYGSATSSASLVTTHSLALTGLNPGSTYHYAVVATDAGGNTATSTDETFATVPDTTPPSIPSNLSAVASSSPTEVDLSWTASTDYVGVAGYKILRVTSPANTGFQQVGTTTLTSYADTGLSASTTYNYEVEAFDSAGNVSSPSQIATAPAFLYNWNPSTQLTNWHVAEAAVAGGTRNARIAIAGDSQSRGFIDGGVGPAGETTDQIASSWPTMLAEDITASSTYTGSWENWFGSGNYKASIADTRIVTTGTFTTNQGDTAAPSLGGPMLASSATTSSLTWTTLTAADTIIIYYPDYSFSFTYSIDGGSAVTVNNTTTTGTLKSTTISGLTLATHAVLITPVTGTTYLTGMEAYNSSKKQISVLNTAYGGAWLEATTSPGLLNTSNPYGFSSDLPTLAPDLTIIMVGVNDMINTEGTSTFQSRLGTMIAKARQTGDVALASFLPAQNSVSNLSQTNQASFEAAIDAAAVANNVGVIDLWTLWQGPAGGYTILNPEGYYSDYAHGSPSGYANVARWIYSALFQHG